MYVSQSLYVINIRIFRPGHRSVVYQYLSKSLFCSFVWHRFMKKGGVDHARFVREHRKTREQSALITYITNATVISLNEISYHHRSAIDATAANNQTKLTKTMKDTTIFFVSLLVNTLYTIIYLYHCSFVFVDLFAFTLSLFCSYSSRTFSVYFCPFIHSKTTKRNSFIREFEKTFRFCSCYRTWNSKCSMIHTNWIYKLFFFYRIFNLNFMIVLFYTPLHIFWKDSFLLLFL